MTNLERIVVSICGPSGSGKSQLAKAIVAALGYTQCGRIPGDNFLVPSNEPLAAFLARPLQYDWNLISQALRLPIGTLSSIPLFDFDTMTRLSDRGGTQFVVRPIMVLDAMYPFPAAHMKILVTAADDVRKARIIERDRRWESRVIDRWNNLEISRLHAEALSTSWDLILDGTQSLGSNATLIVACIARFSGGSRTL